MILVKILKSTPSLVCGCIFCSSYRSICSGPDRGSLLPTTRTYLLSCTVCWNNDQKKSVVAGSFMPGNDPKYPRVVNPVTASKLKTAQARHGLARQSLVLTGILDGITTQDLRGLTAIVGLHSGIWGPRGRCRTRKTTRSLVANRSNTLYVPVYVVNF